MAKCIVAHAPTSVDKFLLEPGKKASVGCVTGVWPQDTEFIQAAMLSAQRVSFNTLYVHWYDNSERARSTMDREKSLQQSIKLMNQVPIGCKLKLIVDASEMSMWFATTSLTEWVEALCKTRGWAQIDTCLVVVSSGVVRHLLEVFPMESRVTFVPSVEDACEELNVDPDVIM